MNTVEIQRRAERHEVVLALAGELDLGSTPQLTQALREVQSSKPESIVIDLRGVDFMDASGVSVMVGALLCANEKGHRLTFRRGPAQVQRLFELTGLLEHLAFVDEPQGRVDGLTARRSRR